MRKILSAVVIAGFIGAAGTGAWADAWAGEAVLSIPVNLQPISNKITILELPADIDHWQLLPDAVHFEVKQMDAVHLAVLGYDILIKSSLTVFTRDGEAYWFSLTADPSKESQTSIVVKNHTEIVQRDAPALTNR